MVVSEVLLGARFLTDAEGHRTDVLLSWEVWLVLLQLLQALMEQLEQQEEAEVIEDYLKAGSQSQNLSSAKVEANPLVKFAGIFKDDPMFDEFLEAIARNRQGTDLRIAQHDAELEERQSA